MQLNVESNKVRCMAVGTACREMGQMGRLDREEAAHRRRWPWPLMLIPRIQVKMGGKRNDVVENGSNLALWSTVIVPALRSRLICLICLICQSVNLVTSGQMTEGAPPELHQGAKGAGS